MDHYMLLFLLLSERNKMTGGKLQSLTVGKREWPDMNMHNEKRAENE